MSGVHIKKCTICFINVDGITGYLRHIRQVHGNDRQFSTYCPFCDTKSIFTHLKSFVCHVKKHISRSSPAREASPPLPVNHSSTNMNLNLISESQEQATSNTFIQCDPLVEIEKYYIKMLLKLREGHALPGNVMNTVAVSLGCLIQTFSYYLLSELNMGTHHRVLSRFTDDIKKALFEISRNEESFASFCQLHYKFVRPKEIQLLSGSKAYYIPIRDVLMNLFGKKDFYECIKNEKIYIDQFNGQDILYHYRNSEIGQQHRMLTKNCNCFLLQLYSDDIGVVNPLMGKNAIHKLTTFYFSIDDLPARHNSSLNAVYLLLLYYRKDFEDQNNRKIIFCQLNEDLKSLENDGLILPGDTTPTYFTISTLCADNLAGYFLKTLRSKRKQTNIGGLN